MAVRSCMLVFLTCLTASFMATFLAIHSFHRAVWSPSQLAHQGFTCGHALPLMSYCTHMYSFPVCLFAAQIQHLGSLPLEGQACQTCLHLAHVSQNLVSFLSAYLLVQWCSP